MTIIADDDLRSYLGISTATHDVNVTNAVNAANDAVVQWCGRDFQTTTVGQETARVFHPGTGYLVEVDDFYDITNLVVKTDDGDDGTYETTWAATDYQLEPLNGRENGLAVPYDRIRAVGDRSFTTCSDRPSVQVTAAWGWTTIPASVKQATLIKAARLFHRKDSPQGVAGFDQFGAVRLSKYEDSDVMMLLNPYRRSENIVLIG